MDLSPHGREFYQFVPTTSPAVSGGWEASFDGGVTWIAGETHPTVSGGYRWLIAGADADATGADAVLSRSLIPDVRAVDSPEIVARRKHVPPINYNAA